MEEEQSSEQRIQDLISDHKTEILELNEKYAADIKLRDKKRHEGYGAYEQQLQQSKTETQTAHDKAEQEKRGLENQH